MKTHWKKLTNPNYIGAYSMPEGKDLTVEITDVKREVVKGEGGKTDECTVLYLKDSKPMILNVTNSKMISKVHNTPFIEEWIGKKITLYVSTCCSSHHTALPVANSNNFCAATRPVCICVSPVAAPTCGVLATPSFQSPPYLSLLGGSCS